MIDDDKACDHGIEFDAAEARRILGTWRPNSPAESIAGNPGRVSVRKRFPRLFGQCPKGCGFDGIGYASYEHYILGDW